jgi:hypothetical protein
VRLIIFAIKFARWLLPPLKYSKSRASPSAVIDTLCDLYLPAQSKKMILHAANHNLHARKHHIGEICNLGALLSRIIHLKYFPPPVEVWLERGGVCACD